MNILTVQLQFHRPHREPLMCPFDSSNWFWPFLVHFFASITELYPLKILALQHLDKHHDPNILWCPRISHPVTFGRSIESAWRHRAIISSYFMTPKNLLTNKKVTCMETISYRKQGQWVGKNFLLANGIKN